MLRRVGIAALIAVSPVALAFIFMASTNDPDEGANIGGGIAVLLSVPTGVLAGLIYLLISHQPRR
jgi:ABC-type tungstate transport system substrate-binding protein